MDDRTEIALREIVRIVGRDSLAGSATLSADAEREIAEVLEREAHAADLMLNDLAMLVRMLASHVPSHKPIKAKALDYLARKGLQGSPLREDAPTRRAS